MTFAAPKSPSRDALPLLSQRPYALILALVTASLTNAGLLWLYWHFGIGADYEVFWRAVRNPTPYAYSPLPFGNPPTTLIILQPLRLFGFWPGLIVWDVVTFVLFFVLGSRLYGRKAALLGAISPAVVTALIAGQISLLVGALVFGAFLCGPLACGILLGFAVCAKPQMVFLAPLLFLFAREFKPLVAFCATGACLAAAATLAFGPAIWTDWIQGMHNLLFVAKHRGALFLTISPMTRGTWIGFFSVPASVLTLYLCRDLPKANRAAALVAASLFAAPYSMVYDLSPLAVFAAVPILRSATWRSIAAALAYSGALGPMSIPCLWPSLRERHGKRDTRPSAQRLPSWRTWMMPTRSA